ncbi:hypothetical protein Taro_033078 [Colocasia esculenta]|uniref:Uncharacterized protein n=1 Tax=Colocasia esculenta TaxID=4460 RepID=A0A843W0Q8_COLES|nr:hypothetical protein [Colocasia esculenta]
MEGATATSPAPDRASSALIVPVLQQANRHPRRNTVRLLQQLYHRLTKSCRQLKVQSTSMKRRSNPRPPGPLLNGKAPSKHRIRLRHKKKDPRQQNHPQPSHPTIRDKLHGPPVNPKISGRPCVAAEEKAGGRERGVVEMSPVLVFSSAPTLSTYRPTLLFHLRRGYTSCRWHRRRIHPLGLRSSASETTEDGFVVVEDDIHALLEALGYVHGAQIIHAPEPVHGRLSEIEHAGCNLFLDIPSGSKSGFKACALYNNWWPMLTGKDPTKSNICFNRQACISSNIR